jgi:spore coat protein U-like protein
MKTIHKMQWLVAALAAFACTGAIAASSMPMQVNASVNGTCKITSVPTINFGALDPSNPVAISFAASTYKLTYQCTKGTTPGTITMNGDPSPFIGSLAGLTTTTETIAYQIAWTNPSTVGAGFSGAGIDVELTPTMTGTAYADVSAQSYRQTVTVDINF